MQFSLQIYHRKFIPIALPAPLCIFLTAGRKWSLIVTIPAATAPGRYREAMKIHTDDEQNRALDVQVNVMVKPDVFINP